MITVKNCLASLAANARSARLAHNVPRDAHNLANQLKERLSKAVMLASLENDDKAPCVANQASYWSSSRLPSLQLSMKYLEFVAEESGKAANIQQQDDGCHSILISSSDQAFQAAHSSSHTEVARMDARLIEAHVHGSSSSTMEFIIDSFPKIRARRTIR